MMKLSLLVMSVACWVSFAAAALQGNPQYGYQVTRYTQGLGLPGPGNNVWGMVWRDDGHMVVAHGGGRCAVPPGGGTCVPLPHDNYKMYGLTRDKQGNYWGAVENYVFQFDPYTGKKLKTIGNTHASHDIHTDPISGDLFVSDPNGPEGISRLTRIKNQNTANPHVQHNYGDLGADCVDGFAFGPDGTFYMAGWRTDWRIHIMYPTNSPQAGTSYIAHPSKINGQPDGVALQPNPNGGTPYIIVNTNREGVLRIKYDDPKEKVTIASGGTRGDFVRVGPDGCLYATTESEVYRITPPDGVCNFQGGDINPVCASCADAMMAVACSMLPNADGC